MATVAVVGQKPRTRVHFAVRFAAGAMRVAAVLTVLAGAAGTYAVLDPSQIPGAAAVVIPGVFAVVVAVLLIACAVVAALVLWGFADALILLADLDDAQRMVRAELADLVLEARTTRGPFHHEVVAAARSEQSAMKPMRVEEPPALKA